MAKETGGPAFPWCGDLNDCPTINLGMTLRDYFAAAALANEYTQHGGNPAAVAQWAYAVADAMLEARK